MSRSGRRFYHPSRAQNLNGLLGSQSLREKQLTLGIHYDRLVVGQRFDQRQAVSDAHDEHRGG